MKEIEVEGPRNLNLLHLLFYRHLYSVDSREIFFIIGASIHGKVKVVKNQVYCRSKVVFGMLRVLSTLVVGFSVKKGQFYC